MRLEKRFRFKTEHLVQHIRRESPERGVVLLHRAIEIAALDRDPVLRPFELRLQVLESLGRAELRIFFGNDQQARQRAAELISLDEAMKALAELDPQKSRIVELRFFGGLSIEETAEVLGIGTATVIRQWKLAKAWLYNEVSKKQ